MPGISGIGITAGAGAFEFGGGNAAQVVQALIELPSNLMDSRYHKDFTGIIDRTAFSRGGTPYIQPWMVPFRSETQWQVHSLKNDVEP